LDDGRPGRRRWTPARPGRGAALLPLRRADRLGPLRPPAALGAAADHRELPPGPGGFGGVTRDALVDALLGLLPVLHDVPRLEEDLLELGPPLRHPPEEKLQVHAEMLELLALRVGHDR